MEKRNISLSNCSSNHTTEALDLPGTRIVSIVFLSILSVAVVHGNILILRKCMELKRKIERGRHKNNAIFAKRISTIYLIFSLGVSDLLVGALCVPTWLTIELFFNFIWQRNGLAAFVEFIDIIIGVSSISNVSLLSISRCCNIAFPFHSQRYQSIGSVKIGLFFIWTFSLIVAVLRFTNIPRNQYVVFVSVFGFGVPLLLTILSYIFAMRSMKQRQRNLNLISNEMSGEQKIGRTLLVITLLIVAFWSPFFMASIIYNFCIQCARFFEFPTARSLLTFIKWLHYFNSFANPWIISHYNKQFRFTVKIPFLPQKDHSNRLVIS